MQPVNKEYNDKILQLLRDAMQSDQSLREKYKIGDKFRFIRDRLQSLCSRVEESVKVETKDEQNDTGLQEDEVLVYVYLYNAHGLVFQTWRKMLIRAVFYEYSVNRPIYGDRMHVEAFIRTKANKVQHGYITIALKKQHVLSPAESAKDALGHPILKIREGSLDIRRVQHFTHNGQEYILGLEGEVTKKPQ